MLIPDTTYREPSPMSDDEFSEFLGNPTADTREKGLRLLSEARRWWEARASFREERADCRNYYRSRQWEKYMTDPKTGYQVKEKDYIEGQGRLALVMNMVANVVTNVKGQFLQNRSERLAYAVDANDEQAVEQMNLARRAVRRYNDSHVIEGDQFEEHIVSGAACFKSAVEWDHRLQRYEIKDYAVDQTRLFFNTDVADRRFTGLRIIGELHDLTIEEIVRRFAKDRGDAERIRELYGRRGGQGTRIFTGEPQSFSTFDARQFLNPLDVDTDRVFEVWKPVYTWVRYGLDPTFTDIPEGYGQIVLPDNEIARRQNMRREMGLPLLELDEAKYCPIWHYYFLHPNGEILTSGPTPYLHGEHPYSPGLNLLVDGETWGLVSNIRDPQRWLNRLLAQIDHMMGAGKKGGLLYNKNIADKTGLKQSDIDAWYASNSDSMGITLTNGMKLEDFLHQAEAGQLPQGYMEMLPLVMGFLEKISGVTDAMQGFEPKAGTPAALYSQQILQGATSIYPSMRAYFDTLRDKDRKEMQLILQAFQEPRSFAAQGGQQVTYDPSRVMNYDWEVEEGEIADTITYRQYGDQFIESLWQSGQLPIDVLLMEHSHPIARKILQDLNNYRATINPMAGASPQETEMLDKAIAQANTDADRKQRGEEMKQKQNKK